MDFYSPDDLSAAKIQLLKDSQKVNSVNFLHVPQQRQGENRATREVDNMFTLLTALDESENASLSALPVYVSNDPDNMPSVRLYEGDFGVLMSLLDYFKSKLGVMESAISSVARDVYSMHTKVMSLEAGVLSTGPQPQPQQPLRPARSTQCDVNNVDNQSVVMGQTDGFSVLSAAPVMTGISSQTADSRPDRNSQLDIDIHSTQSNDWASLVSTSLIHDNCFNVLATTDHSDGGLFVEQRSARVKRRRPQLAQQRQQKPTDQGTLQQNQTQRRRTPAMSGKSTTSSASVAAAKQIRKKAVFCVDNVGTSYTADDIRSFVSSMSISVISCFEVKPRRRRNDERETTDRKAFRLCIWAEDQDHMLDPSKWPSSIMISTWYREPQSQPQGPDDKRRRVVDQDGGAAEAGGAVGGHHLSTNLLSGIEHMDNDQTILTVHIDDTVVKVYTNNGD